MTKELIFAGFGGQGVILAGKILCIAAMKEAAFCCATNCPAMSNTTTFACSVEFTMMFFPVAYTIA